MDKQAFRKDAEFLERQLSMALIHVHTAIQEEDLPELEEARLAVRNSLRQLLELVNLTTIEARTERKHREGFLWKEGE